MRYILFITTLILFVSCANTADTYADRLLQGEYRVIALDGKRIRDNSMIFNFDPVGNRVSGITGCNNFSANYSQQGQELDFSTPMNTRKFCEGKMQREKQILTAIESASRLQFDGNEVLIFADEDRPLITLTKIN